MSRRTPLRHPTGWRGSHYYVSGGAWSGCGDVYLSDKDSPTTSSYEGDFAKKPQCRPHAVCERCRVYAEGRRDAVDYMQRKGKVPEV